jgi:hypothetical protein
MMDNERRADLGRLAIGAAADETNVSKVEGVGTCVTDVLAYIAHFCDRIGADPREMFEDGLRSYEGDFEDGEGAKRDELHYPSLDVIGLDGLQPCPVCGAHGEDESCSDDDRLIDDHAERGPA